MSPVASLRAATLGRLSIRFAGDTCHFRFLCSHLHPHPTPEWAADDLTARGQSGHPCVLGTLHCGRCRSARGGGQGTFPTERSRPDRKEPTRQMGSDPLVLQLRTFYLDVILAAYHRNVRLVRHTIDSSETGSNAPNTAARRHSKMAAKKNRLRQISHSRAGRPAWRSDQLSSVSGKPSPARRFVYRPCHQSRSAAQTGPPRAIPFFASHQISARGVGRHRSALGHPCRSLCACCGSLALWIPGRPA